MSEKIRIAARRDEDFDDLESFFDQQLRGDPRDGGGPFDGDLIPALDLVVDDQDDRAQLDDVEVVGVSFSARTKKVKIDYKVVYSASHGCKDMNYTDTDDRTLRGVFENGHWIFDVFQVPPGRSTLEEF